MRIAKHYELHAKCHRCAANDFKTFGAKFWKCNVCGSLANKQDGSEIKSVRSNTPITLTKPGITCSKCSSKEFISAGDKWRCYKCGTYVTKGPKGIKAPSCLIGAVDIGMSCTGCGGVNFRSRGHVWKCDDCGKSIQKSKAARLTGKQILPDNNGQCTTSSKKIKDVETYKYIKAAAEYDTKSYEDKDENNKVITSKSKNKPYTLEELLEEFKVDVKLWKANNFKINSWDVTTKDGTTYTNYQSKVTLTRDNTIFKEDIIVDELVKSIKAQTQYPKQDKRKVNEKLPEDHKMLLINAFDLHLDKLADFGSTMNETNFDIAAKNFNIAIDDVLTKATRIHDKYDTIIFPIGNDLFNADTLLNTTTKGTHQNVDGMWDTVFRKTTQLIINTINKLKQFCDDIDIPIICGNHDTVKTFYIGQVLKARYFDDAIVTIWDERHAMNVFTYGSTLIGFTHGDKINTDKLPLVLAQNYPGMWGSTKNREIFCGHYHHKHNVKFVTSHDATGVTVRYMRSISGIDEWHAHNAYISIKGMDGYIISPNHGVEYVIESKLQQDTTTFAFTRPDYCITYK